MKQRMYGLLAALGAASSLAASEGGGYLFATFRGEATPMTEQVYFMVSENGLDWEALNEGKPALVSTVGERGVRDPYILRAHDESGFYLIATDLSIHLNPDWGRAQTAASQSIVIWESPDLVNWSEPRLVKVAPDNAGCAWAPEAIYDEERGEYMIFWASKTADDDYRKHRIWAVHTPDFRSFSEPFVYIEKPTTVIDTTIVREDGVYYRFTKDEQFKAITLETSDDLMDGWEAIEDFSLAKLTGYEGPACFRIPATEDEPARWCLLIDWYSRGRGYQAYATGELSTGDFEEMEPMRFPFHPVRHGSVLPVTGEEMQRLRETMGSIELRATSASVKPINLVIDWAAGTIQLPAMPDADLTRLDPGFAVARGLTVSPTGPQDFSRGPVRYRFGEQGAGLASPASLCSWREEGKGPSARAKPTGPVAGSPARRGISPNFSLP